MSSRDLFHVRFRKNSLTLFLLTLPLYTLLIVIPLDTFLSRLLLIRRITAHGTLVKDVLTLLLWLIYTLLFKDNLWRRACQLRVHINDLPFLSFACFLCFQIFRSPYLASGVFAMRGFLWFSAIFLFIGVKFRHYEKITKLIKLSLFMSGVVASYGLYQVIVGANAFAFLGYEYGDVAFRTTGGLYRIISTTDSAASLAAYAMIWICISVGIWIYSSRRTRRIMVMLIIILSVNLFLTTIRGAWLGLMVGLLSGWLINKRFQKWSVILLLLIVLVSIGVNVASDGFLSERILSIVGLGHHTQSIEANQGRWGNLAQKFNLFFQSPVLGMGLGTTGISSIKYASSLPQGYIATDNFYLKMLVETGLIGLILYSTFYISFIYKSYVDYYNCKSQELIKGLLLGIHMALVALGVMNFFHSILESPLINITFWLLAGIITAVSQSVKFIDERGV